MADANYLNEALALCGLGNRNAQMVRVLEAGCGSATHLKLDFEKSVTGVDIDPEQLENNTFLDEKILGDIQTIELPPNAFDLVVSVDVVEHLPDPTRALSHMVDSVKPGGYLLIACPEAYSYKGFLAKFTPHVMRQLIFRVLTGKSHRTMFDDNVAKTFFPTYLRPVCSRNNMRSWGADKGLRVLYDQAYDSHSRGLTRPFRWVMAGLYPLDRLVRWTTKGRVDLLHADFCMLFEKPAT